MDPKKADELRLNAELFYALMSKDHLKVINICRGIPKGPLHIITIHDDTVLHLAAYHRENNLVLHLLNIVAECEYHKLTWQNNGGNTILHETCTNNSTVEAAREMLRRAPMLLSMTNKSGETALFYAAFHGKTKIFKFLHGEVSRTILGHDLNTFLRRDDKSTILHIAILSRNYKMAFEIAVKHQHLIYKKDGDKMTPLQLLSCNPPDIDPKGFFERIIFYLIDPDVKRKIWKMDCLKRFWKKKKSSKWAMELAKVLIENDTSWEVTESRTDKLKSKSHQYGKSTSTVQQEQILMTTAADQEANLFRTPDTPLMLATKHGFTKIVEGILRVYPQAIEHVDEDGRNVLHVAIMYRRKEIIDAVIDMEYPTERLRGKIDNYGNSLLHMVGERIDDHKGEIKSPALVLKDDTHLYKRVEEISRALDPMKLNSKGKTAELVFIENNAKLRAEAKEWMSETAKNCSIVAVLIATVAFAAAYTVPGGPNQDTGYPLLKHKPLFLVFTIADAISLSTALTSVIIFLNILTSPFRFEDFKKDLVRKLWAGLTLLVISVTLMMVAFAATLILTISSGRKWTDITLYVVSFCPVCVFVLMYAPLYAELYKAASLLKRGYHLLKKMMKKRSRKLNPPSTRPTSSTRSITPSIV